MASYLWLAKYELRGGDQAVKGEVVEANWGLAAQYLQGIIKHVSTMTLILSRLGVREERSRGEPEGEEREERRELTRFVPVARVFSQNVQEKEEAETLLKQIADHQSIS